MSRTKLVTLQIELHEDVDDIGTHVVTKYYVRVHWDTTDASIVSPLFDKPLDAFRWAGELIA